MKDTGKMLFGKEIRYIKNHSSSSSSQEMYWANRIFSLIKQWIPAADHRKYTTAKRISKLP